MNKLSGTRLQIALLAASLRALGTAAPAAVTYTVPITPKRRRMWKARPPPAQIPPFAALIFDVELIQVV